MDDSTLIQNLTKAAELLEKTGWINTNIHIQDTFNKAAELIEEKGWVKGRFATDEGYCLLGSLLAVDPIFESIYMELQDRARYQYVTILRERIRACTPDYIGEYEDGATTTILTDISVTQWNDREETTKEQVLAVLRGQEC